MADFCCHYLTVAPSQSACSADSSPKGRAKGRCRICPPNYILAKNQNKKRCRKPAAHFICHRNQTARSTLLERRHLVQAYSWQGVPFTTAFTRLTLGFHSRLERLWEWETLIPKVTPVPQKSHFAIHCTSHPNDYSANVALSQALRYDTRLSSKMQALFLIFLSFFKNGLIFP